MTNSAPSHQVSRDGREAASTIPSPTQASAPRARRLHRGVLLTVGIAVSLAGLIAYRNHARYKHFAVHDTGRVYRSAWVDADVFEEMIPKYGIKTVVNLCYPGEMGDRIVGQREAVAAAGARLVELPFPANDTWNTEYPAVQEFEQLLADSNNYPMWIHCQHGRERTVKALAMYDIQSRGMTAKESLESMPLFGMDHPWPVVVFAHKYQDDQSPSARVAQECGTSRKEEASELR